MSSEHQIGTMTAAGFAGANFANAFAIAVGSHVTIGSSLFVGGVFAIIIAYRIWRPAK